MSLQRGQRLFVPFHIKISPHFSLLLSIPLSVLFFYFLFWSGLELVPPSNLLCLKLSFSRPWVTAKFTGCTQSIADSPHEIPILHPSSLWRQLPSRRNRSPPLYWLFFSSARHRSTYRYIAFIETIAIHLLGFTLFSFRLSHGVCIFCWPFHGRRRPRRKELVLRWQ